jgi:hypothetical protein
MKSMLSRCSMQWIVLIVFIIFPCYDIFAQEKLKVKFGKIDPQDFDISSPLIDSNTNAVVVANVGSSEFQVNAARKGFSLAFHEKKRIKLINKNGFDAATIEIPLYSDGSNEEKLESLKAYTYTLENGKVIETRVESGAVLTEKKSKNWLIKKFTFPAIKEGSIIEYSYTVTSSFIFNLQPWEFQGQYPCLWSEYTTSIPEFFSYVTISQGYQPFIINKQDQTEANYTFRQDATVDAKEGYISGENFDLKGMLFNHRWVMKDVPALKEEAYTTTVNNYVSKIEFQLAQIVYPHSAPQNTMSSWSKVSEELLESEYFGQPVNRPNNWLDDDMKLIAGSVASPEQKARLIYAYVRDNFTCNNYYARYLTTSLKDVFKSKSGSVADINLLLIAMLHHEKINAEPILLSTRSRGHTHELYPLMDRYNYVIAEVTLDNKTYFLDAARQRLGFNKLPFECYNGNARIISKEPAACFFSPDSLKETNYTTVMISNGDKNEVQGFCDNRLGYYESLNLRNKLIKMPQEDYLKEITSAYPSEIKLADIQIDSLKKYEEPVTVKYSLELNGFTDDIIYFNPMLSHGWKKNPFASAERSYPVEMPYLTNDMYIFDMEIPNGYVVEELPKSARVKFNEDEGMFEYIINKDEKFIQLQCKVILEKTEYLPEDYQSLRDFFSYVVQKESEQIVFKKKK